MEARDYVRVNIGGQSVAVAPGESLLVACERAGVPVTPSCRAGACQSCLMRATSGTPPTGAQAGLKPAHKIQGYFLACICHPREELSCEVGDIDSFRGTATISSIDLIGPDVVSVKWHRPAGLDFFAGCYVPHI